MDIQDFIFPIVNVLATLTLIGGVIAVGILCALCMEVLTGKDNILVTLVSKRGLLLMLIVATTATAGSLFLSEIAGWTPCKKCWLQRIFMYPQVILLGIALWKRDRGIALHILILCLIGSVIAVEHYWEQIDATFFTPPEESLEPCDDTGVSCARTYTFRYGYITVPMMALTAFVLNMLGSVIILRRRS